MRRARCDHPPEPSTGIVETLHELGLARAWRAIAADPAGPGAHRFVAELQQAVDHATAPEVLEAVLKDRGVGV